MGSDVNTVCASPPTLWLHHDGGLYSDLRGDRQKPRRPTGSQRELISSFKLGAFNEQETCFLERGGEQVRLRGEGKDLTLSADVFLPLGAIVSFIPNTFLSFRSAHKAKQVWEHDKMI